MEVTIFRATPHPIDAISIAAGQSTGRLFPSDKRFETCWNERHDAVMEHAYVTFQVSGVSRACTHQMMRHRLFSPTQLSQRYTRVDTETDDWYVIPPHFNDDQAYMLREGCRKDGRIYERLLKEGALPEDARYVLPESCKSDVVITTNLRELLHFFDARLDKSAQWEIRAVAQAVLDACKEIGVQWARIMEMYEERRNGR